MSKSISSGGISTFSSSLKLLSAHVDWSLANAFFYEFSTNQTFTFANARDGRSIKLLVSNNGGATRTLTWPADCVNAPASLAPGDYRVLTITRLDIGSGTYLNYFQYSIPSTSLPTNSVASISDRKSSGISGGIASAGDQTRVLDTVDLDVDGIIVSLSSNQFTLQAGTYEIEAVVPGYSVDGFNSRLRILSSGVNILMGTAAYAPTGVLSHSFIKGSFTIASTETLYIVMYATTGGSADSLGKPVSSGLDEVYTTIKITKIA
jgi:hypothetical protein